MGIQDLALKIYRFPQRVVLPKGRAICCSLKIAFLVTLILVLIQAIWLTIITFINVPLKVDFKEHIPIGLFGLQLVFAIYMLILTIFLLATFNKWRDGRLIRLFKTTLGVYILVTLLEMFLRLIANLCFKYFLDLLWVLLIGLLQIIGNGYLWVITNTLSNEDAEVENVTNPTSNSLYPAAPTPVGNVPVQTKIVRQSVERIPKTTSSNNPLKSYTINTALVTAQTSVSRPPTRILSDTQVSVIRPLVRQSSKTTQTSNPSLNK
ncbi:uncharacterized protein LOC123295724 [Chrysoperla carnea]|uniref:uncharacterized protein LOC123295724 n=1 Tax=Chrysoperla carnea TaxID=189513 RepID=UPI001D06FAE9|nr:uncharacterized protein LOC123295724 [Chrysoperla carnea]